MNKKFMIGGCAAIAVAGNVFAAAEEDYSYFTPYASLKAGCAFLGKRNDIKYKCGFAGGVELGMSYDAWKFGLELGIKSNKIKENGGYSTLGKASGAECLHRNDVHTAATGLAGYNYVINNDLSVFSIAKVAGNGNAGLPMFGIDNATFEAATGHANTQNDKVLALRKVAYFEMQKLSALTGMLNVCYDYAVSDGFSVYGGLGLGVARVNYTAKEGTSDPDKATIIHAHTAAAANADFVAGDIKSEEIQKGCLTLLPADKLIKTEHSKTVFAWQLMAGVGYEFNENWKLTLGYKLFNTAKVKQTFAGKEYKIKTPFNHTAELGLTYTF